MWPNPQETVIFDLEVYFPLAMLLFYLIILLCSLYRYHSFHLYFKHFF